MERLENNRVPLSRISNTMKNMGFEIWRERGKREKEIKICRGRIKVT